MRGLLCRCYNKSFALRGDMCVVCVYFKNTRDIMHVISISKIEKYPSLHQLVQSVNTDVYKFHIHDVI